MAAETADTHDKLRAELNGIFEKLKKKLAQGLAAMKKKGELRRNADPTTLAIYTLATMQGALLLAKTNKNIPMLRTTLDQAMVHLRGFAA